MYFRTAGELHRCIKCVGLLGFLYAGTSPESRFIDVVLLQIAHEFT